MVMCYNKWRERERERGNKRKNIERDKIEQRGNGILWGILFETSVGEFWSKCCYKSTGPSMGLHPRAQLSSIYIDTWHGPADIYIYGWMYIYSNCTWGPLSPQSGVILLPTVNPHFKLLCIQWIYGEMYFGLYAILLILSIFLYISFFNHHGRIIISVESWSIYMQSFWINEPKVF